MPSSNFTRNSILMKRLTDARSNIQLKRRDQDNSVKKYDSVKISRYGISANKSVGNLSKQPKQPNLMHVNDSDLKRQQSIPMSVNMYDNYVTNFHSNMVPKLYYAAKNGQQSKITRNNSHDDEVCDLN